MGIEAQGGIEVEGEAGGELSEEADEDAEETETEENGFKAPSFGGDSLQDKLKAGGFGGKFRPGLGLAGLFKSGAIGGIGGLGGLATGGNPRRPYGVKAEALYSRPRPRAVQPAPY